MRWAYALALLPTATDWLESGRFPNTPREWITEAILGVFVLGCIRALAGQADRLAAMTRTDALTGLPNRRAFDEDLDREVFRAQREGIRLTLAFLDIDGFKPVNDRFGHDAGDALLRSVAAVLAHESRSGNDLAYRLGGDEFAVLMCGADSSAAREAVGRLRELALEGPGGLKAFGADVSVGVVELNPGETLSDFYKRADDAMYAVKRERKTSVRRPE
ncbi:MAG: GGDEF domain-containing protein [Planctomycetes bacterium]|nr:GGDEF domain-containing protein [Planctomycetota bacterium]